MKRIILIAIILVIAAVSLTAETVYTETSVAPFFILEG
jgi:hypothetical protein